MGRKKGKKKKKDDLRDLDLGAPRLSLSDETKRGIAIVILITLGLITFLSLINLAGSAGYQLDNFLKLLFGMNRWYVPFVFLLIGYFLLRPFTYGFRILNGVGLILFILSYNGFLHVMLHSDNLVGSAKLGLGGGLIGLIFGYPAGNYLGYLASLIMLLALTLIGLILLFETPIANYFQSRKELEEEAEDDEKEIELYEEEYTWLDRLKSILPFRSRFNSSSSDEDYEQEFENEEEETMPDFATKVLSIEQQGAAANKHKSADDNSDEFESEDSKELNLGVIKFKQTKVDLPLTLLDGRTTTPNGGDLKANIVVIQRTFKNFGIPVEMGPAQIGPTVTQYTLKPAEGVKLSRITGLNDNLALALAAHPIRIEAPIPGKSLVGIEVPNQATANVPLHSILASEEFKTRTSNLTVALGKDVMGKPWMYSLEKMPHLLIAGATGSGKSVCINTLILSLLFQNGPGELKFIMVDPKRVELPGYNNIPHLLTPVITDVKKTVNSLRWSIKEMERRFDVLSAAGYRNIASYNKEAEEKLPYIVIVIDELADLMAVAGQEVEALIVRLSQMARAVGIHLVLATQRPSVDVITGLIKANIPARIAFSVASLVDSRTILDTSGAEKLLGKGDMLFISAELGKPKRLQGAYASDAEIKKVIDHLKKQAEPDYIEEVVEKQASPSGIVSAAGDEDGDELLDEAKEVIMQAGKASASLLQRRLRVGYARAARILDLLEEQGIIGPGEGAKPREVLISSLDDDTMDQSFGDESEELSDSELQGNDAEDEEGEFYKRDQ